jgi:hypothetical protein
MKKLRILTILFALLNCMACSGLDTSLNATQTSSLTITPLSLTATPRATITATPIPAWVSDFANPILADIAKSAPDIEDDFEQPSRAWVLDDWCSDWRKSYENGEIVITRCHIRHSEMHFTDYVVEVDGHFVSGPNPGSMGNALGFQFMDNLCGYYVSYFGGVEALCNKFQGDQIVTTGSGFGNIGFGAENTNHLLMIVKDTRFAFFLNGQPVGYFEDKAILPGGMSLGTQGGDTLDIIAAFDNFKAWDITDLEVP